MFVEYATQGRHAGCAQKTLAIIAVTAREGKRVSRPLGCCPGSDSASELTLEQQGLNRMGQLKKLRV